ncbi:MAG: hypothetical protein LBI34_02740 [Puniceicoccales bacterium]|jgi:glycosyltransferase involved in cell wall biosynthesis|nr:hypothetical protein [Puniceicoccales bacterium]
MDVKITSTEYRVPSTECESSALESLIEAGGMHGLVGVSAETSVGAATPVRTPRIGSRRMATTRSRRVDTEFLKASSPELERQLYELAAGQIDELPKAPIGTRRAIIAVPPFIGERRFGLAIGDALTKFGYEWCICSGKLAHRAEKMNSDIFISTNASISISPPSQVVSLLYIHSPYDVSPANYQYASTYDNFLFAQSGTEELEEYLRKKGKKFRQLKTYLTLGETDFCDSRKERIAFVGHLWDPRRRDDFAKLFQLLDKTGYCDFYGSGAVWKRKNFRSWKGAIPMVGPGDVRDVMTSAGIALLLHHKQQFESGSAVFRDFEALQASCVIISEKTSFMLENFGDCVLFIDTERPAEEIFAQIDGHVKWIHEHPEEAIEMARKSHQIFCDKFSLEVECEKILNFANEISVSSQNCLGDDKVANQAMTESS